MTNHYGANRLIAKSAGSQPVADVHPLSIKYLAQAGISTDNLCSQSWHEHENWQPDVVITVCDSAAAESCPVWFGDAVKVHWPLQDPSSQEGSEDDIAQGFKHTITLLQSRISKLLELDFAKKEPEQIRQIFKQVGSL